MKDSLQNNTPTPRLLIDSFGRQHNNLRISVTDRCNIRCFYCMPADNPLFMERKNLLTFEEIERIARIAVTLGVNKIRLTGGEPLVRRDLPKLVQRLAAIPEIIDIGLTTNGILLADFAQELWDAGLRRINVSLDALDPIKFREITRRDSYEHVLAGIKAAQQVGFNPVKINAVSIRGMTEDQIVPFGYFARETAAEIRFIEFMPLDADNAWERKNVLFAQEIIDRLSTEIQPLLPIGSHDPAAPATLYQFEDGNGRIGFIPSVSQPFCSNCNRFRLTADGKFRNCLFSLEETDVKTILRAEQTNTEQPTAEQPQTVNEKIAQLMLDCIAQKKAGHEINSADFVQPDRPMYSIGG